MAKLEKFTDPRDGRKYRIAKIGSQTWMAENLAYVCEGSRVYGNDQGNAKIYGLLYNQDAALKAVPPGWHLPTNKEWNELLHYVDGVIDNPSNNYNSESAGWYLKARSGWDGSGNGADDYGFSALPGGYCRPSGCTYGQYLKRPTADNYFNGIGTTGIWWTASNFWDYNWRGDRAYYQEIRNRCNKVAWNHHFKEIMFSARCVRDCEPGEAIESWPKAEGDNSIKNALRLANSVAGKLTDALETLGSQTENADIIALSEQARKLCQRICGLHKKSGLGKNFRPERSELWRSLKFCERHLWGRI